MANGYRSMPFTCGDVVPHCRSEKLITIKNVYGEDVGGDVVRLEVDKSIPVDLSEIRGTRVRGHVVNVISTKKQKIDTLIRDLKPFLADLSEQHRTSMEQSLVRLASAKGPKRQKRLDELQAFVLSTGSSVLANVISPYFS